ncbi:MAG TPA: FAD-dependent oxidoreductase [Gaiellaceae bacterium]|nr:FAD-dependent oxidoreductase [Gaiellaceae bacterium]
MPDYRYLIVGGGMTADAACRGIRDRDETGSIGLISEELHPPYSRPPLSKGLWQGQDEAKVWRGTEGLGVELHLGRRVVSVDRSARQVRDSGGDTYGYEQLLLASGGRPRRLPGDEGTDVIYFRYLDDYRRLRALADRGGSFVVLGGGFIGSEIAAALRSAGCEVTLVFAEDGVGARIFPADLAEAVTALYRGHGVEIVSGELVEAIAPTAEGFTVTLRSGRTIDGGTVVAGLGIEPATELAEAAGLEVSNGIVVDELGRAGDSGEVWAAGDVARFPSKVLGTDMRVEHEDQANSHGRAVGANMAGAGEPYSHQPFFYSDLFELGYEAVGDVDARNETMAEWDEPFKKGVVAYVDGDRRPRGFLMADVWGKVDAATELIAAGAPVNAAMLRGLIG